MKILIATGLYAPDIGGPATYTVFLERHLPRYGIDFTVVPFSSVRTYPKIIRHCVYLFRLIREGRNADILYALDTVSVGVPALLASMLLGKKLYLRVPGDYAWEQGQQRFGITATLDAFLMEKEKPLAVRVLAWLQSCVARHATKIIVPSEYMKRVVREWGTDPKKITRIYSALSPISIADSKEILRSRFGYNGTVVVTAARLVPWKGIETLIDVVVSIRKSGEDISLEILGDGDLREDLEKHIEHMDARTYVHMRGAVPKQELAERIKAGDVFVLNTSYEGLSHQLIEVMDIGTPIITTPVGGNSELITNAVEGLVVEYNDCVGLQRELIHLIHDVPLRGVLVERAREKVKLFREDVIIPEIATLFS